MLLSIMVVTVKPKGARPNREEFQNSPPGNISFVDTGAFVGTNPEPLDPMARDSYQCQYQRLDPSEIEAVAWRTPDS